MNNKSKIEVTLITGFLGAGKTTFINQVLKQNPEKQFALVENEFGEVAIDTKLIKGVDASQMFELKQGCICCTITDEFELVLQELAERFSNVEHLLIESTGVADPASVIRPFYVDENLKKIYQFNGTICLLDAINFYTQPEKEVALKQIATADLVLINKFENIQNEKLETLQSDIRKINPLAKMEQFEYGRIANFDICSLIHQNKFFPEINTSKPVHLKISTKTIRFQKALKRDEFIEWLTYNLDIYKNEIYRVKGILQFENEPFEYILQGVGGSFELIEGDLILGDMDSQLILIGIIEGLELDKL